MNFGFARATTALMREARLCAIDLGYDYITTIHLFLADCQNNTHHSIRDFVFTSAEAYQQFYDSQRVAESGVFDSVITKKSLPITVELEQSIQVAQKQFEKKLMPYHLFLAASQLPESLFYSMLEPKEGLQERLLNYYTQKGITVRHKALKKNLWQRLIHTIKQQ